jgi:hypothetical protein
MGRQIAIAAIGKDEQRLLDFLRESADVQLFESFAPTCDELRVDDFASEYRGHIQYKVWNTAFDWEPAFGQVGPNAVDPSHVGWFFLAGAGLAPLLEISRTNPDSVEAGRLYWNGGPHPSLPQEYDVAAFGKWVDTIFRWVRKNGTRTRSEFLEPYVFPEAAAASEAKRQNGPACAGPI